MRESQNVFYRNGNTHTKEEYSLLSEAAKLRSRMAKISVGEEKQYQKEKLQELMGQMLDIIKEIAPEVYEKMMRPKETQMQEPEALDGGGLYVPAAKRPAGPGMNRAEGSMQAGKSEKERRETLARECIKKEPPGHGFQDIAGMEKEKARMARYMDSSRMWKIKKYLKLEDMAALLFVGPPGCGKTHIIQAFAHEIMTGYGCRFISANVSDILSRYVGEAEKILTSLFQMAVENAPCLLFFDEIDGVCRNRSAQDLPDHSATLTTSFLTGFDMVAAEKKKMNQVYIVAATNYPGRVDSAVLDRMDLISVGLPDQAARADKFKRDLAGSLVLADDLTFDSMAGMTENYNYRDLDRLINSIKLDILDAVWNGSCRPVLGCGMSLGAAGSEDLDKFQDEAIDSLKAGAYILGKDKFSSLLAACPTNPKEDILREIRAWEKAFHKRKGED